MVFKQFVKQYSGCFCEDFYFFNVNTYFLNVNAFKLVALSEADCSL